MLITAHGAIPTPESAGGTQLHPDLMQDLDGEIFAKFAERPCWLVFNSQFGTSVFKATRYDILLFS